MRATGLQVRSPALFLAPLLVAIQACSSGSDGGTSANPAISVTLSATTATVEQGGSVNIGVTVTSSGGFTGTPAVTVTGLPTGVTWVISNVQISGNTTTATVLVNVAATTAAGTYPITVNVTGTGVTTVTKTFTLTVTPVGGGNYTLASSPAAVSVTQAGVAGTSTITITRTGGFAGSIAFSVTGAPSGVTASVSPTSTTGNTVTLTVTAGGGATVGAATLTITGVATGLSNRTTSVALTVVSSGGSGSVSLNFSACDASLKPIWLAYQNGTSGAWTRVTGVADVYAFSITQSKGGYAYVTAGASTSVTVNYASQAELSTGSITFCTGSGGSKTVNGTAAGLAAGDFATISLGGGSASVFANGAFSMSNVAAGTQDLVGYRTNVGGSSANDRMIIRRDQNIAAGGSVGTVDFGSGESFATAAATITLSGAGADAINIGLYYLTGSTCSGALLSAFGAVGTTVRGVPAAQQRASDYHELSVSASASATATRTLIEVFHTLADRAVALGVALPSPTVTVLTGTYKRLQAALTLPADYQSSLVLTYTQQGVARSATVGATFAYLGAAAATLAMPDLSGTTGWLDTYAPASGATATWSVSATGSNLGAAGLCSEGARVKSATVSGSN